jgi:Tol biopolymer transport system component
MADNLTPDERLDSWKEIAAYLKRDITTLQRWEKREGMPVRRHLHDKLGSVYAFRSELDAWTRSRNFGGGKKPVDVGARPDPADAVTESPAREESRVRVWTAAAAIVLLSLALMGLWVGRKTEYFWRSPIADARFQRITDWDGAEQAAAISRDGRLVAFQSNHDGQMDVWIADVETSHRYNRTNGRANEIVNPALRALSFSPDGALVTFWTKRPAGSDRSAIGVWAVPALGGEPQPYLENAAEFDWSADASQLVYHSTAAGDPTFIRTAGQDAKDRPLFKLNEGAHAHFQVWSPDRAFIYFVQGEVLDNQFRNSDIWRITPDGGAAQRITFHNSRVTHPVFVEGRTLLYLATDPDGSGPWLYSLDVNRRVPHRLSAGADTYTTLAVSADSRRLVLTLARPKGTLWRIPITDHPVTAADGTAVSLTTGRGVSPRIGPDYLLYVSSTGTGASIWKIAGGTSTEVWTGAGARIFGGPEIDRDGRRVAFSVEQQGRTLLYVMNVDGTQARLVSGSLSLLGSPAWEPSGDALTTSASVNGTPRLFRIALDGSAAPLGSDYAIGPAWSRDGRFVVYSGPDVGTSFALKAVTAAGAPYAFSKTLTLTRGARRVRFLAQGHALVVMRGNLQHKDLWRVDLDTGAEKQLTRLDADFNIHDFDISPDGRELVLERVQDQSDVVLLDRSRR